MARRNKHAARFGVKYTCPPLAGMPPGTTLGQVTDTLRAVTAALPRMVDALRQISDNMRQAREMEETTRQVAAIINGRGSA